MDIIKNQIPLVISLSILSATWFENIPRVIYQPDGHQIECFITGDQYARRLHDRDDFTILQDPADGFYYYAKKDIHGEIFPSPFMVGRDDPLASDLVPGYFITQEEYEVKKNKMRVARFIILLLFCF